MTQSRQLAAIMFTDIDGFRQRNEVIREKMMELESTCVLDLHLFTGVVQYQFGQFDNFVTCIFNHTYKINCY